MNKMVKGSVAGAAGIVLLMGGFGTYALWQDSETLQDSEVTSGELDIAANSVDWEDVSPDASSSDWDPQDDLIVPGDVIERTQEFQITARGKNLTGTIDFTEGAQDVSDFSNGGGTPGNWMTIDVDVTSASGTVTETAANSNDFEFDAPFGSTRLTAVVTYTFDEDTPNQAAQDATASLADSAFLIQQTR